MPSSPLTRCWLAPAPAPKGPTPPCCPASLLVALDRCGQTADLSHASHTLDALRPFRAGRLLRRLPARGAAAGTRRHAPRGSPSAPPLHPATPFPSAGHPFAGPHPTRPSPLPALCPPARPSSYSPLSRTILAIPVPVLAPVMHATSRAFSSFPPSSHTRTRHASRPQPSESITQASRRTGAAPHGDNARK